MNLLLIRHGQSNANQLGLLISNGADTLSALGKQQSEKLKNQLECLAMKPELVYSSPWMRARQTAETLFPDMLDKLCFDNRLAETNPGIFGVWKEELFNQTYPQFHENISNQYEGGESHQEMARRVQEWVSTEVLTKVQSTGTVCAVAHGGPISVVIQMLLGIPIESNYPTFTVPNASFSLLKWHEDKRRFLAERIGQT